MQTYPGQASLTTENQYGGLVGAWRTVHFLDALALCICSVNRGEYGSKLGNIQHKLPSSFSSPYIALSCEPGLRSSFDLGLPAILLQTKARQIVFQSTEFKTNVSLAIKKHIGLNLAYEKRQNTGNWV